MRGTIGVLMLLDGVLGAVDMRVLAAGGVATPRGMATALAAGTDGVRIGTRLLLAEESSAHPGYRSAVMAARASDTVVIVAFKVGWPRAPHRVLRASPDAASSRAALSPAPATQAASRSRCSQPHRRRTRSAVPSPLWPTSR